MKAFRLYWNDVTQEDSVDEVFVTIIAKSIRDVVPAFERAFPNKDVNHIRNLEPLDDVVIIDSCIKDETDNHFTTMNYTYTIT